MMKFYRKNIKLIIWLIVLAFVIWGAGALSVSREAASPYAGSVHGKKVSHKEFLTTARFYDLLSRAQAAQAQEKLKTKSENETSDPDGAEPSSAEKTQDAPANPNPELPSAEQVRGLAWQMILLSREAEREKVQVSNEEVRREVERLFSGEGMFNQEQYQFWIENTFRSRPRDFEEVVRNHLAAQKMREHVVKDVPENEKESRWTTWLISAFSRAQLEDYIEKNEDIKVETQPSPEPAQNQTASPGPAPDAETVSEPIEQTEKQ
jgi:hypothetical protein